MQNAFKKFAFETEEGVDFLASGIETGESDNQALVFDYILVDSLLTWEFVKLDELQGFTRGRFLALRYGSFWLYAQS